MNFIDRALADKDNMSADDFLQAMADIYHETEVWDKLNDYPLFVRDVIYIIDYDSELHMEGLESFCLNFENQYQETYDALMRCGAVTEAEILKEAESLDFDNDDDYEKFSELESRTALENDYQAFWNLVRAYIAKNLQ